MISCLTYRRKEEKSWRLYLWSNHGGWISIFCFKGSLIAHEFCDECGEAGRAWDAHCWRVSYIKKIISRSAAFVEDVSRLTLTHKSRSFSASKKRVLYAVDRFHCYNCYFSLSRTLGGCLDDSAHCYTLEVSFYSYMTSQGSASCALPYTEEGCILLSSLARKNNSLFSLQQHLSLIYRKRTEIHSKFVVPLTQWPYEGHFSFLLEFSMFRFFLTDFNQTWSWDATSPEHS